MVTNPFRIPSTLPNKKKDTSKKEEKGFLKKGFEISPLLHGTFINVKYPFSHLANLFENYTSIKKVM